MAEDYALIDSTSDEGIFCFKFKKFKVMLFKGRSLALIALIRCLVNMGKTILLTSSSNNTLDVLVKDLLKVNFKFNF